MEKLWGKPRTKSPSGLTHEEARRVKRGIRELHKAAEDRLSHQNIFPHGFYTGVYEAR